MKYLLKEEFYKIVHQNRFNIKIRIDNALYPILPNLEFLYYYLDVTVDNDKISLSCGMIMKFDIIKYLTVRIFYTGTQLYNYKVNLYNIRKAISFQISNVLKISDDIGLCRDNQILDKEVKKVYKFYKEKIDLLAKEILNKYKKAIKLNLLK